MSEPAGEDNSVLEIGERAVTQEGDVWSSGGHVIVHGDSRIAESFEKGLQGRLADMVFGDLPYNLKVDGFIRGREAKNRFRESPAHRGR